MTKELKGSDIILNLKEIEVMDMTCRSSSYCSGPTSFTIDCETKHGYYEDPDFTGKIEVLKVEKDKKEDNVYTLKIKFTKEETKDD